MVEWLVFFGRVFFGRDFPGNFNLPKMFSHGLRKLFQNVANNTDSAGFILLRILI